MGPADADRGRRQNSDGDQPFRGTVRAGDENRERHEADHPDAPRLHCASDLTVSLTSLRPRGILDGPHFVPGCEQPPANPALYGTNMSQTWVEGDTNP